MPRPLIVALAAGVGLVTTACDDADALDGAVVYQARCGYCHDAQGAIGTPLTDAVLRRYRTVGTLRSYLPLAMPYEAPGSLTSAEYEAVLRHLLVVRGLIPERFGHQSPPDSLAIGAGG